MEMNEFVDMIMACGPTLVKVGLLVMAAYHFWNRNIIKGAISMGACIATFVLGW